MERFNYFLRRLLLIPPTLLGITLLCFALIQFVPGGPVEQKLMQMRGMGSGEGAPLTAGVASAVSAQQRADLIRH
ncbi:MAG: ABC transporter permease, partial [bacterium]